MAGHPRGLGKRWRMTGTLCEWLKANDLAELEATFVDNQVDLKTLEVLTDSDLKELGLPFGPRKRILNALAQSKGQAALGRAEVEAPSGPATSGERRQLTLMFCDLVGSRALSAELDPEELHALISAYRNTCGEVVLRYEGHVAQVPGGRAGGVLGWPIAHEDAAERGVGSGSRWSRPSKPSARPNLSRFGSVWRPAP